MDRDAFQQWLDRYIDAWRSNDPASIGDLFSSDAQYFTGPFDDPINGRDAIVKHWLGELRDEPDAWQAEYRPLAVEGDVAVSIGESRYRDEGATDFDRVYSNIFACRFDSDGRCREFREWFIKRKSKVAA